jgi:G3E family GTPase
VDGRSVLRSGTSESLRPTKQIIMHRTRAQQKTPVTVIAGPLGAGKSTLLRHIITEQHGSRIALIENEFAGSVGVEGMILKDGVEGDAVAEFVELANGCICCSQRDGLVQTLHLLMSSGREFDAILVETSGLANPGPVASIFWTDTEEALSLTLDGIVTLVDAANFERQMHLAETIGACAELADQVGYADVILLNKADTVLPDVLDRIEQRLRGMSSATIHRTSYGRLELTHILNLHCYDGESGTDSLLSLGSPKIPPVLAAACSDGTPLITMSHTHSSGVAALELHCSGPLSIDSVQRWLGSLLWDHEVPMKPVVSNAAVIADAACPDGSELPPGLLVLRAKGLLLGFDDRAGAESGVGCSPAWFLLQSVHETFDITAVSGAALSACHDGMQESRVVLIGRSLPSIAVLQSSFEVTCTSR